MDNDFESSRRQDVKEYVERRYNHDGKVPKRVQNLNEAGTSVFGYSQKAEDNREQTLPLCGWSQTL